MRPLALAPALVSVLVLGCGAGNRSPSSPRAAAPPPPSPPARLVKQYTEYAGRLTNGAHDDAAAVGLRGTDLGVSFERDGKIWFLFGDSWTFDGANWDDDSIAWTPASPLAPGARLALSWVRAPRPAWMPPRFLTLGVPGFRFGGMEVPLDAIPHGATTYVFFSDGFSGATGGHGTSVLAHAAGSDFGALALDHAVPSAKFLNVSAFLDGTTAWIFGSGLYRASDVYLAQADIATIADRASWLYFRGTDPSGAPDFGPDEATAAPLFPAGCVGELSVRPHPALGLFLMTYNCGTPRGVHLRTAPAPWGPWSDPPEVIFAPGANEDRGYEHFMHADVRVAGHDDGLAELGRENEWGGEYGPYLVPQWFTDGPVPGSWTIVYVLSSWNPYAAHLLRTVVAAPGVTVPPPARGAGLPRAALAGADFAIDPYDPASGWQWSGDRFVRFFGGFGTAEWRLTTYAPATGDGTRGQLWQDFTVDAGTSELRFRVHGGHAAVRLVRVADGEVLRETRGRDDNTAEVPVVWRLETLRGETVRLLIEDDRTDPWGFVSVSGFELR